MYSVPRLWLMNEEGSHLLQLQQDRLVVNRRKLPSDTPCLRYRPIREFLVEAWEGLAGVLASLGHAFPEPSICEVQYVNHLDERSGWGSAGDTSAVIAPWSGSMSDGFLPPPERPGSLCCSNYPMSADGSPSTADPGDSGTVRRR